MMYRRLSAAILAEREACAALADAEAQAIESAAYRPADWQRGLVHALRIAAAIRARRPPNRPPPLTRWALWIITALGTLALIAWAITA